MLPAISDTESSAPHAITLDVKLQCVWAKCICNARDAALAWTSMTNNELVFYVKLFVKPERVEEWLSAVKEIIQHMSREEAFVACYLHRDASDPNLFTLYERWNESSVESFLQNQMKPYRLAYDAKLPELLQRPREPAILEPIQEWHKSR